MVNINNFIYTLNINYLLLVAILIIQPHSKKLLQICLFKLYLIYNAKPFSSFSLFSNKTVQIAVFTLFCGLMTQNCRKLAQSLWRNWNSLLRSKNAFALLIYFWITKSRRSYFQKLLKLSSNEYSVISTILLKITFLNLHA